MKTFFTTLIFFSSLSYGFSATTEKSINSEIDKVTVYLNGAQVERKGIVSLKRGINTLVFQGVSPYLNPKTIQVSGLGDYIILDSKKSIKYPDPVEKKAVPSRITRTIEKMKDSIKYLNFERSDISAKLNHLNTERKYILANKIYYKDTLPVLKESLAYLRKQLFEITELEHSLKVKNDKLSEQIVTINKRLKELNNYQNNTQTAEPEKPIHQIEVTVQAKKTLTGSMTISYFVSNASWSPSYDIRVKNSSSPVELTMKGTVYQNTGENWDNVKLTLSTNNPYKNKVKPELSVWYINYYNPNIGYYQDANVTPRRLNEAKKSIQTLSIADEVTESSSFYSKDYAPAQ